jgi:4-amino-4-deoxy-L-arabinose transferase-like glycosyltransferase
VWLLPAVLGISLALNLINLDFPVRFHGDEWLKVESITDEIRNFKHPLLMIQLTRAANLALGLTGDLAVAVLGRALMGIGATLTVLWSYMLARRTMSAAAAVAVAASVAVAPTLVMHAHYLKEDTILTTCLIASVLCFLRFVERPDVRSAAWLGVATGLAFSAHYKAILLVPLYLIAPLMAPTGAPCASRPARFYGTLLLAGAVATGVFFGVNWPIFLDLEMFGEGLLFEAQHAQIGHDVPIRWNDYWLGFHLLYSLAPGLGVAALSVAAGGLIWAAWSWKSAPLQDRWLLAYVLVFYLVPEVSPLKPWPDFSRYMMPIVPPLLYFGWQGLARAAGMLRGGLRPAGYAAAAAALIALPLYTSVRLVSEIDDDTRFKATEWLKTHPGKAIAETYAAEVAPFRTVAMLSGDYLVDERVDYLVASSFTYERFLVGATLPGQDPRIHEDYERYMELFARPYVEIAPAYRSFAFSNPVIRIIDMRD